jgi:DNA-binding CsgD family transcriptional regulator
MNRPIRDGVWALTEKEKQILRLIVRGHDAKSSARSLGLSVHTINERLRDARRKLVVSSSREAARLLLEAEGGGTGAADPDFFRDMRIGEDAGGAPMDQGPAPIGGARRATRRSQIIIGVLIMTLALGLLALVALPQDASTPPPPAPPSATSAATNAEVVDAARRWLGLLDQSRWDESYRGTATAFRRLNTLQAWTAASLQARAPLGAIISRTLISEEELPAPPHGYEVVKFRTRYANRGEAVETVTLDREGGAWRVVGVTIG